MDEPHEREDSTFFYVNVVLLLIVVVLVGGGGLVVMRFRAVQQARAAEVRAVEAARLAHARAEEEAHRLKEQNRLAGQWLLADGEQNGQRFTPDQVRGGRLTLDGDQETVVVGTVQRKGKYRLYLTRTPHGIDALDAEGPFQGETLLGVYDVVGGQLRMSFAAPGEPRPATPEQGQLRYVWKRARPQ